MRGLPNFSLIFPLVREISGKPSVSVMVLVLGRR